MPSLIGDHVAIGTLKGKIYLVNRHNLQVVWYQAHDVKITGISIYQIQES